MAQTQFKGTAAQTSGDLPAVGSKAPCFKAVGLDLAEVTLADFAGKTVVLNIFPSIDTGICATSTRTFNEQAASRADAVVLCVSLDLPFALKRFCGAEGIENVQVLSVFRSCFGKEYGLVLEDSPLKGLLSRAVIVINGEGLVSYTELVSEITQEPNYNAAWAAVSK